MIRLPTSRRWRSHEGRTQAAVRAHHSQGQPHSRIVRPLLNLPVCAECHGADHTVRGLIDIQHDITTTIERQRLGLIIAAALFLAVVAALGISYERRNRYEGIVRRARSLTEEEIEDLPEEDRARIEERIAHLTIAQNIANAETRATLGRCPPGA